MSTLWLVEYQGPVERKWVGRISFLKLREARAYIERNQQSYPRRAYKISKWNRDKIVQIIKREKDVY